jgi:hypothetical protein
VPAIEAILAARLEAPKPSYRALNLAEWEAALAGKRANNPRQQAAQTAYRRSGAGPGRAAVLKRWQATGAGADALRARLFSKAQFVETLAA